MRILQISDLHFGINQNKKKIETESAKRNNYLDGFIDKVRDITSKKPIEYVLLTGDIAYWAAKDEYEEAEKFLRRFSSVSKVPFNHMFLCPGNHDVDRDVLEEMEFPKNQERANVFLRSEKIEKLSVRHQNYIQFCEKLKVASYKLNGKSNYLVGVCAREDLNVISINTAWFAKSNEVKREMWVGANFVEMIKSEKIFQNGLPTITIMHHPYTEWNEEERSNFEGSVNVYHNICKISDIVLSGHTHEIDNAGCYYGNTYVSGSGALYEKATYHHNFHVYDLNLNTKEGSKTFRTTYRYNSGEWQQDQEKIKLARFENKPENSEEMEGATEDAAGLKLDELETNISIHFLDTIVDEVQNDKNKMEYLQEVLSNFIYYKDEPINWEMVLEYLANQESSGKSKRKIGLSIEGYEGTGKSTFLSVLYLKLKELNMSGRMKPYPILIDIHHYDSYKQDEAVKDLQEKLDYIDNLMVESKILLFLIFDGCDDFPRVGSVLEKMVAGYIKRHPQNLILCIGKANEVEKSRTEVSRSPLHSVLSSSRMQLQSDLLDVEKAEDALNMLNIILEGKSDRKKVAGILYALKRASLDKVDFRTMVMCIRVGDAKEKNGSCCLSTVIERYLENTLENLQNMFEVARISAIYTTTNEEIEADTLCENNMSLIYRGKLIRDYLIAYYFVKTIEEAGNPRYIADVERICGLTFIFTPVINRFAKELFDNITVSKQGAVIDSLIMLYNKKEITMSMKSQICYFLGRFEGKLNKSKASLFLEEQAKELCEKIYEKPAGVAKAEKIQMNLVLYRTVSVSLFVLGDAEHAEDFLKHLLSDERLNSINRGFHIEYYSDRKYKIGDSPNYYDDFALPVDKTISFLQTDISSKLAESNDCNICLLYLDILTLYSIFESRMFQGTNMNQNYADSLLQMSYKVLESRKVTSLSIRSYVSMMKEMIAEKAPYQHIFLEFYNLKLEKRRGWINRNIKSPESIADHILSTFHLANAVLPDTVEDIIKDYPGVSDIDRYRKGYNKSNVLWQILVHDLAEAYMGDIVNKTEEEKRRENERFAYYEMLCTLPKIYGLNTDKRYWDEFYQENTLNAIMAHDMDKIEAVIQAYMYRLRGEEIDLDDWIKKAEIQETLGKAILKFLIERVFV